MATQVHEPKAATNGKPNGAENGKSDHSITTRTPILPSTKIFEQFENGLVFSLRFAGFKGNYHNVNELRILGRQIITVQELGLHLVWKDHSNPIEYIKPLPREFIGTDNKLCCAREDLSAVEVGFLYSYARLIESAVDLALALELGLVDECFKEPGGEGLRRWNDFIADFKPSEPVDKRKMVPPADAHMRFDYGDLRLSRMLVRKGWHFKRFYNIHSPWVSFQRAYVKWLVILLAVVSTVLSSMQVAQSADPQFALIQNVFKRFAQSFLILVAANLACFLVLLSLFCVIRIISWLWRNPRPNQQMENSNA
ncbi:hypothetical protein NLG97_g5928 [Lecanicillium saksenae]|uniref:Uncharacterized protein n=1 Tax=Lecanicillium saksenae TaxID=468837 RepID=A0ACC1QR25_9HYPO|nr:hypothetical protein NLG97_g5928 [Lecanicillium saksenae]